MGILLREAGLYRVEERITLALRHRMDLNLAPRKHAFGQGLGRLNGSLVRIRPEIYAADLGAIRLLSRCFSQVNFAIVSTHHFHERSSVGCQMPWRNSPSRPG